MQKQFNTELNCTFKSCNQWMSDWFPCQRPHSIHVSFLWLRMYECPVKMVRKERCYCLENGRQVESHLWQCRSDGNKSRKPQNRSTLLQLYFLRKSDDSEWITNYIYAFYGRLIVFSLVGCNINPWIQESVTQTSRLKGLHN